MRAWPHPRHLAATLATLPPERSPKCGGQAPEVTCLCGPDRAYDRRCQRCRDARYPWRFGVVR